VVRWGLKTTQYTTVCYTNNSYLHNSEKSVKEIDSLNKGLSAVAKETGQAPQLFHSAVSAFCRYSAVILKGVLIYIRVTSLEITDSLACHMPEQRV